MKNIEDLGAKGKKLLNVLVQEIRQGRFEAENPESFISYGEALQKLRIEPRGHAGRQLQREGLNELNEWTKKHPGLPKITGLIVNKKEKRPNERFAREHGYEGSNWVQWWLRETSKAIRFADWDKILTGEDPGWPTKDSTASALREEAPDSDYRKIITIEPGKRGGKPCIRGMRITVGDVLGWLAAGMTHEQIRSDFPELTEQDIRACLTFAAEKENHAVLLPA